MPSQEAMRERVVCVLICVSHPVSWLQASSTDISTSDIIDVLSSRKRYKQAGKANPFMRISVVLQRTLTSFLSFPKLSGQIA